MESKKKRRPLSFSVTEQMVKKLDDIRSEGRPIVSRSEQLRRIVQEAWTQRFEKDQRT